MLLLVSGLFRASRGPVKEREEAERLAREEVEKQKIVLGSTNDIDRAIVGTGEIIARAYFDIRQGGALHLSLGSEHHSLTTGFDFCSASVSIYALVTD